MSGQMLAMASLSNTASSAVVSSAADLYGFICRGLLLEKTGSNLQEGRWYYRFRHFFLFTLCRRNTCVENVSLEDSKGAAGMSIGGIRFLRNYGVASFDGSGWVSSIQHILIMMIWVHFKRNSLVIVYNVNINGCIGIFGGGIWKIVLLKNSF